MAIQDYCIGLKGVVNAIHRVTRALSGNVNSTTISDAVEEVAIAIENGGGGGGGGGKIDKISVNGVEQPVVNKEVNLEVVTADVDTVGDYQLALMGSSGQLIGFADKGASRGMMLVRIGSSVLNLLSESYATDNLVSKNDVDAAITDITSNPVQGKVIKSYVDTADANLQTQIDALEAPVQTQGNWMYKVYSDGTFDAWYKATGQSLTITATSGNLYRSELQTLTLPTDLTDGKTVTIQTATPGASHNNYPVWAILANVQNTEVRYYALSGGSRTASPNYIVTAHVFGTIQ